MKPVIVVPVKAQSDRVPGKNFADLGGRPLYEWTFNTLAPFADDYDVLVVTDILVVQDSADHYGLTVESRKRWWDDLTAWEVAFHATDAEVVALCLVTSPFRTYANVKEAIDLYTLDSSRPVISACRVNWRSVILRDNEYDYPAGLTNVDDAYISNGVCQVAARDQLKDGHISRWSPFNVYEVEQGVGHEIDTPFDLEAARAHVASAYVNSP